MVLVVVCRNKNKNIHYVHLMLLVKANSGSLDTMSSQFANFF